jgi:hypothetical protein
MITNAIKHSIFGGATAGAAVYATGLYFTPATVGAITFAVSSFFLNLVGSAVAAVALGYALPILAAMVAGALLAFAINALFNAFKATTKTVEPAAHEVNGAVEGQGQAKVEGAVEGDDAKVVTPTGPSI